MVPGAVGSHSPSVWMSQDALVIHALLAAVPRAAAQVCTSHSSCAASLYCDSGMNCYMCSYITPVLCDAFDGDCCSPAFLTQCPTNPAACPSPPPGPSPGPGDEEQVGGHGWTITILLLVSFSVYVLGGLGYVRYVTKEEDSTTPVLHNHPHYETWLQLPGLVSDGYFYFRHMVGFPVDGGVISSDYQPTEHFDELPQSEKPGGTALEGTPSRNKKKKKSTKLKPKPKAGVRTSDTRPLLDVDVDSGSPQGPVE